MCVQKHLQTTDINGADYRFFIIGLCSENVGLMHYAWKGSIVYKIYILFWDAILILTHFYAVWQHASYQSSAETSSMDELNIPKSQWTCRSPRQVRNSLRQVNQTPDIQMSGNLSDLTPDLLVAKLEMWRRGKCHHHTLKKIEHWSFFFLQNKLLLMYWFYSFITT